MDGIKKSVSAFGSKAARMTFPFVVFPLLAAIMLGCSEDEVSVTQQPEGIAVPVTVGTLGDENRGNSGVSFARQMNGRFEAVYASRDVERGLLNLRIQFNGEDLPPSGQFLIRLFDKNGSYLTHLLSEKVSKMFSIEATRNPGTEFRDLTYQLPVRDLRDTEMIEFGWAPF